MSLLTTTSMSLLTTILYLLDEADVDGYDLTPDNTDITVDGDAFWKEMEREGLKVKEPRTAFGFSIRLVQGFGKVALDAPDGVPSYSQTISTWHAEADGDETLRQLAWRRYKLLPDNMKEDKWPNLINGAETLQQMTEVFDQVSKMWRVAQWRKRMGVAA
jgi:hypothetical protein